MSTVAHFSLEHYERMVALGAFEAPFRKRLELIRGEIVETSPIGSEHAFIIDQLTQWSIKATIDQPIWIRSQNPIRIPVSDSEPEPDLVWAVRRSYADRHPEPHEVLLVVEVADTLLPVDRGEKLTVYAEAGIPEYWIVNLLDRQIEVCRTPSGGTYKTSATHRGAEAVGPLALPEAKLVVASLFESR